jgi:hypothetical protein
VTKKQRPARFQRFGEKIFQLAKNDFYRLNTGFPKRCPLRKSCFLPLAFCVFHFLFFGFAVSLHAQQPTAASPTSRPAEPDTMPLLFTFALSPERSHQVGDTLPDRDFRMYDPARKQLIDWGTLGNLGSSARPLLYETPARRGFDVGVHAFDLYKVQPNDLRFYRNTRAFSDVFFSQGSTQFDGMLNARFSRTFEGGANVSLDYRTINNRGQYRYQRDKHNALALGIWLPVGKRYDGFLIFSKNVMRQQDNGGIMSDTVFGEGGFSGPISAEVRLPDERALTRVADQTLQLTQHLKFTGAKDEQKRALRATHTFAWVKEDYKFSDESLARDSFFFDTFLTDRRGIRHFTSLNRFDNTFTLSTFKAKNWGRPSDVLAVGLAHSYFDLYQEPRDSAFSNLFATGDFSITPSERFALKANGSLGLLSNFGEYLVNGEIALGFGKVGQLRAGLLSQRRPPSLLHHRLFVSKRLLWQNDFEKPLETSLFAAYALPLIGLELTARTHLINNYLYFDQSGVAAQTTSPVQVVQFIVTENFNLGPVRFENTAALQQTNRSEVVRLPRWFTKNSLYFAGKIFKKRLELNFGGDFRLNSDFRPDGYQPVTWQFHLQDSLSQKPFAWLDLFVTFKIQTFRGFVRYENFLSAFNDKEVFYQTARHPQPFGAIRFGIAWRFMDGNRRDPNLPPPDTGPPTIGPTSRGQ